MRGSLHRIILALVASCLFLVACGPVPAPFRRTLSEKQQAPLVALNIDRGLKVLRVEGLDPDAAQRLVQGLVRNLQARGIVATGNPALERSRTVAGWVVYQGSQQSIYWEMTDATGQLENSFATPVPDFRAGGTTLDDVSEQAATSLQGFLQVPEVVVQQAPTALPEQRLYISTVTGAPGDGDTILPRAARLVFAERGIPLTDDISKATLVLAAEVAVAPLQNNRELVAINWSITEPDGTMIGTLNQEVPVQKGALDGEWREMAIEAPAAISDTIRDVMRIHAEKQLEEAGGRIPG